MCVNLAEVLRSGACVDAMLSGEGGSDGVEHRKLLFMRERGGGLKEVQSGVRRSVAVCRSLIRGRIETPRGSCAVWLGDFVGEESDRIRLKSRAAGTSEVEGVHCSSQPSCERAVVMGFERPVQPLVLFGRFFWAGRKGFGGGWKNEVGGSANGCQASRREALSL